ncbi:MAG TPA: DUF2653 family protein, partial [Chondromyces sp.]|nr:DUF2653 family protein [Chondromyces sp.]
LMYDDDSCFAAEYYIHGIKEPLDTRGMIDALRFWLGNVLNEDPYSGIELVLDDNEGIVALVN